MAVHFQSPNGLVVFHVAVHDPAQMSEPEPQAAVYARKLYTASARYAER